MLHLWIGNFKHILFLHFPFLATSLLQAFFAIADCSFQESFNQTLVYSHWREAI